MKKNNKGFTLAELLIVVAIIAVLVAIAIPIFTSQLEKSREAVDQANIRDAYATIVAATLTEETDLTASATNKISYSAGTAATGGNAYVPPTATITATQQVKDWQTANVSIAGKTLAAAEGGPGSWEVSVNAATGAVTITYSAG